MRTDDVMHLTEAFLQPFLGRERSSSSDLEIVEPDAAASSAAPHAAAATDIMEEDGVDIGQV